MLATVEIIFWWLDLAIAAGLLVGVVSIGWRGSATGRVVRNCFWLGVGFGLFLEVPVFFSALLADDPLLHFIREPPVPGLVILVSHSLWDGGLFLVGLGFVWLTQPRPILTRFRWLELAILVGWGRCREGSRGVSGVILVQDRRVSWNPHAGGALHAARVRLARDGTRAHVS